MARRLRFKLSDSCENIYPGEESPTASHELSGGAAGSDVIKSSIDDLKAKSYQEHTPLLPSYSLLLEDGPIRAIISDDIKLLHHFFRKPTSPPNDLFSIDGTPALLLATAFNNRSIMRLLLDEGFGVNIVAESGQFQGLSPIHVASMLGHTSAFNFLIDRGAAIRANTKSDGSGSKTSGQTCLHLATQRNHTYLCNIIVSLNRELVNSRDDFGMTPLHLAVMREYLSLTRLFLRSGCDVDARDDTGRTPLLHAMMHRKISSARALIKDADLTLVYDVEYGRGLTVLHIATVLGEAQLVQELLDAGAKPDVFCEGYPVNLWRYQNERLMPVHIAVLQGDVSIFDTFTRVQQLKDTIESRVTLLGLAVANNRYQMVRYLLSSHFDPDETMAIGSVKNYAPLHVAVEMGYEIMVEQLLLNKACTDIQTLTKHGVKDSSPLHIACKRKLSNIVKLLISPTNIYLSDAKGMTSLHVAALSGCCKCVELLLNAESKRESVMDQHSRAFVDLSTDSLNFENSFHLTSEKKHLTGQAPSMSTDKEGRLPIHLAAIKRYTSVIETFVRCGFDIDAPDGSGKRLIHLAAADVNLSNVLVFLLRQGVDRTARNRFGYTALHTAAENNNLPAVQVLLISDDTIRNIQDTEDLDMAFLQDINTRESPVVDLPNSDGKTALHLAARGNHRGVVECLLLAGGSVNAKDHAGLTPLHLACAMGNSAVPQLIDAGADLDPKARWSVKDQFSDFTPLHLSVFEKEKDTCELLLTRGADIDSLFETGRSEFTSPLHLALANHEWDIAKVLIKFGVSVNTRTTVSRTPLMVAIDTIAPFDILKAIVLAGADVNAMCNNFMTPLERALRKQHSISIHKVTKLLLNYGADVNFSKPNGRTVFMDIVHYFAELAFDFAGHLETFLKLCHDFRTSVKKSLISGFDNVSERYHCDVRTVDSQGNSILYIAVNGRNDFCSSLLIKYTENPEFLSANGDTVLRAAVAKRSPRIVRQLLEAGANPVDACAWAELLKSQNEELLFLFSEFGHFSDLQISLRKEPDTEGDESKGSLLHFAILHCSDLFLDRLILMKLASVDCVDSLGRTPLFLAISCGKVAPALTLLSVGASVERALVYRDASGRNLIHMLASEPHTMLLSLLTLHTTNIDQIADRFGEEENVSALHIAALSGQRGMMDILIRRGCDVTLRTASGRRATDLFQEKGPLS